MPRQSVRRAWLEWLDEDEYDWFVTFNYGYSVKPINGEPSIEEFFNRLQRAAYGRRWSKRPAEHRIAAVGVWERTGRHENTHCHALVRVPPAVTLVLQAESEAIWSDLQPRGQIDVQEIRAREAVISYVFKRIHSPRALERVYVYSPGLRRRLPQPERRP